MDKMNKQHSSMCSIVSCYTCKFTYRRQKVTLLHLFTALFRFSSIIRIFARLIQFDPPGQHHKDILYLLCESAYHNKALISLEVQNAITDLKHNKSYGLDTLSAEHFCYTSNRLPVLLNLCLNALMLHAIYQRVFVTENIK